MYPSLLVMDEKANKIPYLAKEWGYSDGGRVAWFKLREDAKWQDGTPITAEDVKFTVDVTVKHSIGFNASLFSSVEKIVTPDSRTVQFYLKEPSVSFAPSAGFWLRVVPKHIWEKIQDPKQFANEKPIGAGPFALVRYQRGQYYELEPVKQGFFVESGPPLIDKVIFKVYPDINTLILALKKGEVDLCAESIPPASVPDLKKTKGINVVSGPSLGYAYMIFNLHSKQAGFLADVQVRKALAHAVNKDIINKMILAGNALPIATAVSPVLDFWHNPNVKDYAYDLEQAKKILDAAGYKDTNGDGVREVPASKGGGRLRVRILYDSGHAQQPKVVQILKDDLAKIGVELVADGMERNAYLAKRKALDFDLMLGRWGIMDEPADYLYLLYHSDTYGKGGINESGPNDPVLDKLIEEANKTGDVNVARDRVFKIQERLHEVIPEVHLYVEQYYFAYRDRFTGYRLFPSDLRGLVDPQSLSVVHLAE
jgi:peptide/nickel transport system substrate-binding protein